MLDERRLVPNCRPGFKRAATVMAVLAFSYFFFHTAESYNKGIARRYQACHEGAARSKESCVSISAENRPACIVAAASEENRCLESATDSGQSVLKYWEYWPSGRSAGQRFLSGQHKQSGGSLRQHWSDFKAHRRQRSFHCGRVVNDWETWAASDQPGSGSNILCNVPDVAV